MDVMRLKFTCLGQLLHSCSFTAPFSVIAAQMTIQSTLL